MSKISDIKEQVPFWVPANELLGTGINESMIPYNIKCPFHKDDTPSMRVHKDGLAYCFGCGRMYSSWDVLLKYCGQSKTRAVKLAQQLYHVEFKQVDDNREIELSKSKIRNIVRDVSAKVSNLDTTDETYYTILRYIKRMTDANRQ